MQVLYFSVLMKKTVSNEIVIVDIVFSVVSVSVFFAKLFKCTAVTDIG